MLLSGQRRTMDSLFEVCFMHFSRIASLAIASVEDLGRVSIAIVCWYVLMP